MRGLETRTLCAFGSEPGTVVIVGADGSFLLSSFSEGGEGDRKAYSRFIRSDEGGDDLAAAAPGAVTVSSSL